MNMLATRPTAAITNSSGLPQAIDAFVGSALDLVIHSVETVRDRLGKFALRATGTRIGREI